MKQYCVIICCCAIIFGCDQSTSETLDAKTVLQNQLDSFNWNTVDTYPKFSNCDSIIDSQATKYCFQNTLLQTIETTLNDNHFKVTQPVNDTIFLTFKVSNTGNISISHLKSKPITALQLPQLDSLLQHSLTQLPKLYPAIKQGQQVHTQFTLPIIVVVN